MMTNNVPKLKESAVFNSTIEKLKAGEQPSPEELKEALGNALEKIVQLTTIVTDLRVTLHGVATAHVNEEYVTLRKKLDSLVEQYCVVTDHNHKLH